MQDTQHAARITAPLLKARDSTRAAVRETFDSAVGMRRRGAARALARQTGDRVNIYPTRQGLLITVQLDDAASQQAAPTSGLLDDETKLVDQRWATSAFGLRAPPSSTAGTAISATTASGPLIRWVEECFPGVSTRGVVALAQVYGHVCCPICYRRCGRGKLPIRCSTTPAMATLGGDALSDHRDHAWRTMPGGDKNCSDQKKIQNPTALT